MAAITDDEVRRRRQLLADSQQLPIANAGNELASRLWGDKSLYGSYQDFQKSQPYRDATQTIGENVANRPETLQPPPQAQAPPTFGAGTQRSSPLSRPVEPPFVGPQYMEWMQSKNPRGVSGYMPATPPPQAMARQGLANAVSAQTQPIDKVQVQSTAQASPITPAVEPPKPVMDRLENGSFIARNVPDAPPEQIAIARQQLAEQAAQGRNRQFTQVVNTPNGPMNVLYRSPETIAQNEAEANAARQARANLTQTPMQAENTPIQTIRGTNVSQVNFGDSPTIQGIPVIRGASYSEDELKALKSGDWSWQKKADLEREKLQNNLEQRNIMARAALDERRLANEGAADVANITTSAREQPEYGAISTTDAMGNATPFLYNKRTGEEPPQQKFSNAITRLGQMDSPQSMVQLMSQFNQQDHAKLFSSMPVQKQKVLLDYLKTIQKQ